MKRYIHTLSMSAILVLFILFAAGRTVSAEDEIVFDEYVTEDAGSAEAVEELPEEDPMGETEGAGGSSESMDSSGNTDTSGGESGTVYIYDAAEAQAENTDGDDTYVSNSGEVFQIPRIDDPDARVFDYADLLRGAEEIALTDRIMEMQEQKNADIVILTSDTVPEDYYYGTETSMKYAEQFLMDNGFREDALIFIIDMKNRVLWTAGHGKYSDEKYVDYEERVYNAAMSNARDGNYYGAAKAFLDETYKLGNRLYAAKPTFLSVLFSAVLSLFSVIFLLAKHGSAQPSRAQTPKIKANHFEVLQRDKRFLGTRRTVRHISRESSGGGGGGGFSGGTHSGGGFSGGGGSFSGGGGKF